MSALQATASNFKSTVDCTFDKFNESGRFQKNGTFGTYSANSNLCLENSAMFSREKFRNPYSLHSVNFNHPENQSQFYKHD